MDSVFMCEGATIMNTVKSHFVYAMLKAGQISVHLTSDKGLDRSLPQAPVDAVDFPQVLRMACLRAFSSPVDLILSIEDKVHGNLEQTISFVPARLVAA